MEKSFEEKLKEEFPTYNIRLEKNKGGFKVLCNDKELNMKIADLPELTSDLKERHGLDLDEELYGMIISELRREIEKL
jgi:hypothetical protein